MGFGIKRRLKQMLPKPITIPIVNRLSSGEELNGKVSLISGGSGGIGLAIAKEFYSSGAKVIITGINQKKLDSICSELDNDHFKSLILDYGDPRTFKEKIDEANAIFGNIDIFVSAAGIHIDRPGLDFLNTTLEEYEQIMDINLKGTYFMCQAVAKAMILHKVKGHILLISSQSALEPSWSPYRLSKLGAEGITKGMAQRLLENGVIVNAIGPGPTATSMQKDFRGG